MNSLPCHCCEDLFAILHSRSLKLNIHRILLPHQRYVIRYSTRNVITIPNTKYKFASILQIFGVNHVYNSKQDGILSRSDQY